MRFKWYKLSLPETVWMVFLSILCSAGLNIIFIHVASGNFSELPVWHYAHMIGKAPAPLQYRWISYGLPELFIRHGYDSALIYLSFRALYLFLAFFFAGLIVKEFTKEPDAPTIIVLSVSFFYAVSTQAHFQFAEEPNLLVYSIFIWLVLLKAPFILVLAVFSFGVFNKATVAFLIPFYFIYYMTTPQKGYAISTTTVLSILFLSVYIGLRYHFGTDREYLGGYWQVNENIRFFMSQPVKGMMWTLTSILPIIYLFIRWSKTPHAVKCFIPGALLMIIGHLLISRIEEFRTYTPLALILWPGVYAIVRHGGRDLGLLASMPH